MRAKIKGNDNPLGRYLFALRVAEYESQKEMAKKLGVTASYLSAIEMGKKPLTPNMFQKISEEYNIEGERYAEFEKLVSLSNDTLSIPIATISDDAKEMCYIIKKNAHRLSSGTIDKINTILAEGGYKNE